MPPPTSSDSAEVRCRRLAEALRRVLQRAGDPPVAAIETHISWVLLDGRFAWKVKKPVRLGFLDFEDLATRKRYCDEELRLNRRLAPQLYLEVVPIFGSVDAPQLGGAGEPIEYAVKMRQFEPGALLSERLAAGRLDAVQLERLAGRLALFHDEAPAAGTDTPFGSAARIEADTTQVLDGLAAFVAPAVLAALRERLDARARGLRTLFERRKAAGRVREGHGDLHLANAVALGDDITAFDCIEFDPGLRWIDVCSDIAFLAMDLLAHDRPDLAFRFLDAWLAASGEHDGLPALRYYLVYRALVRALVARIRAAQAGGSGAHPADHPGGPDYLGLAQRLEREHDPRLLVTHGLSGSGKSHLSQRLLERAGAIRLRSDVERKRLFGLGALHDASAGPGEGIYAADATQSTYERLLVLAMHSLDAGYPTIVDATFLRARERDAFRDAARSRGVPFTILHCRAEPSLLRERVVARHAGRSDASDADLAVLERQLAGQEPLRDDERAVAIEVDTGQPVDVDALAARWLEQRQESGPRAAAPGS
ncbi:MAG: AAA family ATPase [Burkholderiaceae bacterium]|nr:AAA family ATPase [Burkholderiaceae bacterium]